MGSITKDARFGRINVRVNRCHGGLALQVLVLCTGNSARSIMAECLIHKYGNGRMKAYSAGSKPVGKVSPIAVELLRTEGHALDQLRSKSVHEFANHTDINLVINVCDSAKDDPCPVFANSPLNVHWSLPDPAAIKDDVAARQAFSDVYGALKKSIKALIDAEKAGLTGHALGAALRAAAPRMEGK